MLDVIQIPFLVSIADTMITLATPILLAALGEVVVQRAGIMNLGIEGTMLAGAFTGFLAAHTTGSLWLGLIAAVAAGALSGGLMAFMSATLKVNQVVAGLAINILASGTTFYLFRVAFADFAGADLPTIRILGDLRMTYLSDLPVVGTIFFSQSILTYVAFALAPLIWFMLYRTTLGLELRVIGENPRVIDMHGISVSLRQYFAVILGGSLAGVGGGFLTLASAGLFIPGIQAGRGYIAFALVIVGNWTVSRIVFGALLFGLIDSTQLHLQAVGIDAPHQILLAMPYILTILALVVSRERSRAPLALGIPYVR